VPLGILIGIFESIDAIFGDVVVQPGEDQNDDVLKLLIEAEQTKSP
jgi:hypothetical protein